MTPDDFLNTSDLANFESEVREISPFFFFFGKTAVQNKKTQELTTKDSLEELQQHLLFSISGEDWRAVL